MSPTKDPLAEVMDNMSTLTLETAEQPPRSLTPPKEVRQTAKSTYQSSPDELNLLAKTRYARSARAINALRDLGIDRMEISRTLGIEAITYSLPQIALVGNQSSGKSSLIEAISQIKLPQSIGTCTRCPMEVRLSEGGDGPWSCTVSLRFISGERTRTEFFDETTNKELVQVILRRAQLAILNPQSPVKEFVSLDIATYHSPSQLSFSEDMIIVEIFGAPVSVTFIDLPGITNPDEISDVKLASIPALTF